jgi:hypothetical protein
MRASGRLYAGTGALSARIFLEELIAGRFQAKLLVVGPDYRFGARGEGDIALLKTWTGQRGIELVVVDEVVMGPGKISSSRIRTLIQEGDVEQAASLLGRPYSLGGVVLSGRRLGRTLGFPTANLPLPTGKVQPALGVYATRVQALGQTWEAITSIGLRPTVSPDETVPVIETHIFDADLHLYGETVTIELLKFIRPEKRFDSLESCVIKSRLIWSSARLAYRDCRQCYEEDEGWGCAAGFLLSSPPLCPGQFASCFPNAGYGPGSFAPQRASGRSPDRDLPRLSHERPHPDGPCPWTTCTDAFF